ncbi:rpl11a [Symbiodinium pilosum]|uniref:Rpl11a protein n=1 Tax=Symbiodinium pilosum TaxID=2952 RepID=A0A812SLN3_SYMPI|nr:rpl11a [Symbiodinium pilosum]
MLLSGLVLLTFLSKHLMDFRFYPAYDYVELKAPPLLINYKGSLSGHIFTDSANGELVRARDLYSREVALFKDFKTVLWYTSAIVIFATHLCLGWKKLVPADAMQIPRDHQNSVIYIGWAAALAVAFMYGSVPWYVYFAEPQVVEHV